MSRGESERERERGRKERTRKGTDQERNGPGKERPQTLLPALCLDACLLLPLWDIPDPFLSIEPSFPCSSYSQPLLPLPLLLLQDQEWNVFI